MGSREVDELSKTKKRPSRQTRGHRVPLEKHKGWEHKDWERRRMSAKQDD